MYTGAALRSIDQMDHSCLLDYYFDRKTAGLGTISLNYRAPYLYITDAQAGTLKRAKVDSVMCAFQATAFETLVKSSFFVGCATLALSKWSALRMSLLHEPHTGPYYMPSRRRAWAAL
jgi:hypothetical protein